MKLFIALLGFCLVAAVAGQDGQPPIGGIQVRITDVTFATTPEAAGPGILRYPTGTVVTVYATFTVVFNKPFPGELELWITHVFNGAGHRPNCEYGFSRFSKGHTIPGGESEATFDFPITMMHLFEPGQHDAHLQIIITFDPPDLVHNGIPVDVLTSDEDIIVLADQSYTHTMLATGNVRTVMCQREDGDDEEPESKDVPLGFFSTHTNMTGPCLVYPLQWVIYHIGIHFWYYNYHYYAYWVPVKIKVEDQAGHYYYIYFCVFIPRHCHGHLDAWIYLHVVYPDSCRFQWFGWTAYCDFNKQGRIETFNQFLEVVPPER